MKRLFCVHIFLVCLMAACTPLPGPAQFQKSQEAPVPASTVQNTLPPKDETVEDLIEKLYISDPSLPQYDPDSPAYADFPAILHQLAEMGPDAMDAASHVAVAIRFPRPDAYLAAQTLLALGPEITAITLPTPIDSLKNQKAGTRLYSLVLLGSVGTRASCAVAEVAPLLWDADPQVRSAAAFALEQLTGEDLVLDKDEFVITPSFLASVVPPDEPEGSITAPARSWWEEKGSEVNWHPSYGICDP